MEAQEALAIIHQLVAPKRLSYLEETLFVQTWQGKLYREIALDVGYELSYLRDVGAKLWDTLSEALGTTVTKKNIQIVLRQHGQRAGGTQPGLGGIAMVPPRVTFDRMAGFSAAVLPQAIQFPGRALDAESLLYVIRPPAENLLYESVFQPSSLTRIQATRQMGKTSLLNRVLPKVAEAGIQPIYLNLRQVDQATMGDLNQFLRWICWNVGEQLGLADQMDAYWMPQVGAKISCTNYFERYLLSQAARPLVLVFDDMTRLLGHTKVAQDVLPMLRTWHEEAMVSPIWQNLRLVLAHSMEIDLPLPVSQSPFNVGIAINLTDFSTDQVEQLASRSGWFELGLTREDLSELSHWVEGHPYLLQLAFHWLTVRQLPLAQLLNEAASLNGIYAQHLRYYWLVLQQEPALRSGLEQLLRGDTIDTLIGERLESFGLARRQGDRWVIWRRLYQQYFEAQLLLPQESMP
jgi:AAA-like domain